jgi:lipopolysaccharide export system protein LptA
VKKSLLFFFLICFSALAFAQQVTQVQLLSSNSFIGLKRNGENTNKVINPVFQQDNATLTCDSAYFYLAKNSFEAFGNVHINQADTINIYSDKLNYDGNTKIAILKNNVKLTDNDAILTTNDLDYNLGTKIGQYYNGGKIVNGKNTLTSKNGYYFTSNKDAYFRYDVVVKSPDALIKSDTLKYNTLTKIAYFFGPTNIYGKTDTLYTENGQYNTSNDRAAFGKNNLYTQNAKSLKGDSLFYDGIAGYGRAVKNILFIDTAQKIELRGNLGIYKKGDESITVSNNAYMTFITEKDSVSKDSIWLTADTLKSKVLRKLDLYAMQQAKIEKEKIANVESTKPGEGRKKIGSNITIVTDSLIKDSSKNNQVTINKIKIDSVKNVAIEKPKEKIKKAPEKIKSSRTEAIDIEVVTRAPNKMSNYQLKAAKENQLGLVNVKPKTSAVPKIFNIELPPEATDTTKIRIVLAYHKVKIFKSDFQAKADSAFFSYGDSIMRIYKNPLVWAQGSQLGADTMYVQMKNKKIDNMDLIRKSIIVNTDKDSLTFNQVAGKNMKAFFKNEKLDVVFVNGNAESIYFPKDSAGNNGMMRSITSKMRINFAKDSVMSIAFIRKPEHNYYPFEKLTEELKTLPNFSWKPKERPKSKEDIIPSLAVKKTKPTIKKPVKEVPKTEKPLYNDKVKQAKPAYEPPKEEKPLYNDKVKQSKPAYEPKKEGVE